MKMIAKIEQLLQLVYGIFLFSTPFFTGYLHTKKAPFLPCVFGIVVFLFIVWSFLKKRVPKLRKIEILMLLLPFLYLIPYFCHFDFFPSLTLHYFLWGVELIGMAIIFRQVFQASKNDFLFHVLLYSACFTTLLSILYFSYPDLFSKLGYCVSYADFYPTSVNRLYGPFIYPNTFVLWNMMAAFVGLREFLRTKQERYFFSTFLCLLGIVLGCSKMMFLFGGAILILYGFLHWKEREKLKILSSFLIASLIPCLFLWNRFYEYMFHSNFALFFFQFLFGMGVFFLLFQFLKHFFKTGTFLLLSIVVGFFLFPVPKPFHISGVSQEKNQYLADIIGLKPNHSYLLELDFENRGSITDGHLRLSRFFVADGEGTETIARISLNEEKKKMKYFFKTSDSFEYYLLQWIHIGYGNDVFFEPIVITDVETREQITIPLSYVLMPYPLMMQERMRTYDKGSVVGRSQIYQDAFTSSKPHFLVGQGGHAFYHYLLTENYDHRASEEHSFWFQLVMEVGFLGVLWFLTIVLFFGVVLLRLFKKISFLWVALFLLLLGSITFDFTMSYGMIYFFFFFILEGLLEEESSLKKDRVMFISSAGGHLTELLMIKSLFSNYKGVLVTEKNAISMKLNLNIPVYYLHYCSRFYFLRYLFYAPLNGLRSIFLFLKVQPDLVYTTGAHTSVVMCYLAWLFHRKVIFVEVYDRTFTPTLSGRLIYPIADQFFVQQKPLLEKYPKATYITGVYE